jgi:hypothetical protein
VWYGDSKPQPKLPGSESWPQEKQYERDETERQQSLKALFADPQHWKSTPPITASNYSNSCRP